jgi:hypothetical protein
MRYSPIALVQALVVVALASSGGVLSEPVVAEPGAGSEISTHTHEGLEIGITVPVFVDTASLHAKPDDTTEGQPLPVGTRVTNTETTDEVASRDGYQAPWYKVKLTLEGSPAIGYVRGVDLPFASIDIEDGLTFIAGIRGQEHCTEDMAHYCMVGLASMIHDGKTLAREPFTPVDSPFDYAPDRRYRYDVEVRRFSAAGFSPTLVVIALTFTYEACDYENGDMLFTWNGSELNPGPIAIVANSVDYAIEEDVTLIWPQDQGGKPNCLFVKYTHTPKPGVDQVPGVNVKSYYWDGKRLFEGPCPDE